MKSNRIQDCPKIKLYDIIQFDIGRLNGTLVMNAVYEKNIVELAPLTMLINENA